MTLPSTIACGNIDQCWDRVTWTTNANNNTCTITLLLASIRAGEEATFAQPVVGRSGVVKPLQMALQRAHIQLRVSIQIVLQQSLVDEGVLHLRRKKRR
ncbi:hypothetical protein EYF80_007995 [Liparis tanakae]|uniref:Uncharacterized protein n=1 Tax=Liparis tanakae TaxID=230148 RepID=A0A4Z2IVE8_9TELE|nr:hypothetical protein EYF80_007995 [Liparis tanakae]